MNTKTVGLCLSGGGARGLAHIGILKALREHNIKPTHISGTSMGAIIGVLYASGYSIDEMINNANKLGRKEILPDWVEFWKEKKKSFLSIKYLRKLLKSIPYNSLEQLPIPVSILDTGYNYIYQEGNILELVSASSAIPGLFDPIKYQGHLMIDGGISNNFPLESLMDCDMIIGSDVNYCYPRTSTFGTRDVLSRAMTISTNQAVQAKRSHCHLFIQPQELDTYSILDFDKAQAIITIGYDEACRQLSQFTP